MHTDSQQVRVGLVGFGLAGASFHAPLIQAVDGLVLQAIVTASAERSSDARRRHPGATIVTTFDALLGLADDLDLVVIAAPNRAHGELARRSLAAGLNVVVDKPLCATAAEARDLVARGRDQGRMLTVFQNRRWDSDALTLASLLESGRLGAVHRFESRFERWRPTIKTGWRELPGAAEGGGILLDLGAHLIDQALHLFGPARLDHAEIAAVRPGAQVDDDVFLALHHPKCGVRSHLWMSAAAAQPGPRMRVLGDRGAWVTWGLDPQEDALRAGGSPGDEGFGVVPREQWGTLGAADGEPADLAPLEPVPGDYRRFYAEVVRSLRAGTAPPVAASDAVAVLELIEAARELVR